MTEQNRFIASMVTRDLIAGIFGEIRLYGVEVALQKLALEYVKAYGPNIHVEWYLKQTGTPYEIPDKHKEQT